MRDDGRDGDALAREVERGRSAVAVTCGSDARHALRLERRDDLVEVLPPDVLAVAPDPGADVEVPGRVERVLRDGVAAKVVRDDRAVAVAREVVRKQLARRCQQIDGGGGSRRTLLLLRAIPNTSVRKRTTFVLSYSPEGVAT